MISLFRPGWVYDTDSEEVAWAKRYRRFEAERAFLRARWSALGRALAQMLSARKAGRLPALPLTEERNGTLTVPLSSIVGIEDGDGSASARSIRIRRRQREAWVRMFNATDFSAYPALAVHPGEDGWLLDADPAAALVVEILRARSQKCVRVTTGTPRPPAASAAPAACRGWTAAGPALGCEQLPCMSAAGCRAEGGNLY